MRRALIVVACILLSGCGTTTKTYRCEGKFNDAAKAKIFMQINELSFADRLVSLAFGRPWDNVGSAFVEVSQPYITKSYGGLMSLMTVYYLYEDSDLRVKTAEGELDNGLLDKRDGVVNLGVSPAGHFKGECVPSS